MKKNSLLAMLVVITAVNLFGCSEEEADIEIGGDSVTSAVYDENSSSNESTETSSEEEASSSEESEELEEADSDTEPPETNQQTVEIREYSSEEKRALSQKFLEWAIPRAETGNMAVSDFYLGHGASGKGDWYAATEDGEIQIQQQSFEEDLPGYDAYTIHALGGVVFYTSLSGVTGYDETPSSEIIAAGFSKIADPEYPMHKYLLGDNGIVYELIGTVETIGTFSGGYGLYDDDGVTKSLDVTDDGFIFERSDDEDAQEEWFRILTENE